MNSIKYPTSLDTKNVKFIDFVSEHKETFKKRYLLKISKVTSYIDGNKLDIFERVNPDITKKWKHLVDGAFNYSVNDEFLEKLCLYCQLMFDYYTSKQVHGFSIDATEIFINQLKLIKDKIDNIYSRSKVIDKYFNYSKSQFEYLLENGSFIPVNMSDVLKINISNSYLPKEVLILLDEAEFRDKQLEELI